MRTTIDHTQILPRLEPGLTLLETPSARSSALHSVVIDALVGAAGEALWIDARSNASTYALYDAAPHDRALRDLRIARAFTAFQHHTIVRDAVRQAGPDTDLVVAPCVAALYRDDDLPDYYRPHLVESTVALLAGIAASLSIPVVITEPGPDDDLWAIVDGLVDHAIACVETPFGYRYEAEGFETTVYWCDGHWQTTIPYWVELLGAVEAYERAGATAEDLAPYVTA